MQWWEIRLVGRNQNAFSRQDGGKWITCLFAGCMDLSGQGAQVSVVSRRSVNWGRTEGPCVQLLNGDPRGRPSSHGHLSHFSRSSPWWIQENIVRMKTPEIWGQEDEMCPNPESHGVERLHRLLDLSHIRPLLQVTTVAVMFKRGASVTCDWSMSLLASDLSFDL